MLFHLSGTFAQDKYFGFQAFASVFAWGDAGVEFFFVLSGFLITLIHRRDFGQPRALAWYLVKRGVRIYPSYWLVAGAVCLAAWVVPVLREALPNQWDVFAKAFLLLPQDPAAVGAFGSPILFVAWSLQYELLFYAVIAAFIANRMLGALVAVGLVSTNIGCHLADRACSFPASFAGSNLVLLFGMGVAAAFAVRSAWRLRAPRAVGVTAAIAFVGFGAVEAVLGRDTIPVDRRLVYGMLAALMIVAFARAEDAAAPAMKSRWLGLAGDASYALYLTHIPVISVLCKLAVRAGVTGMTGTLALLALFIAIAAACVAVAVGFHVLVERPLLAWLQAHLRRRIAPPAEKSAVQAH